MCCFDNIIRNRYILKVRKLILAHWKRCEEIFDAITSPNIGYLPIEK